MTDKNRPHDWPSASEFIAEARKRGVGLLGPQAKIVPYFGVTGFTRPEQVDNVLDSYTTPAFGNPHFAPRQLMVGVLASWETLNGEKHPEYPERYPEIEDIPAIFAAASKTTCHAEPLDEWPDRGLGPSYDLSQKTLRLIHYHTKEPNLLAQLDHLCEIAGQHLGGFQLNTVWPNADDIRWWAEDHPTMRIVLQINSQMFSNVARKPQLLVEEIGKKYVPWITDVLFDMSGGAGQAIDLGEAGAVLEALYGALGDRLGIGVAGGLDHSGVVALKPLFERYPRLSCDAEAKIADKRGGVNGEAARYYLRNAFGIQPLAEPITI